MLRPEPAVSRCRARTCSSSRSVLVLYFAVWPFEQLCGSWKVVSRLSWSELLKKERFLTAQARAPDVTPVIVPPEFVSMSLA